MPGTGLFLTASKISAARSGGKDLHTFEERNGFRGTVY
jgi:hypothetical protein